MEIPIGDYGYDILMQIADKDSFEEAQGIIINNADSITFKAVGINTKTTYTGLAEIDGENYKYKIKNTDFLVKDNYSIYLIFNFINLKLTAQMGILKGI